MARRKKKKRKSTTGNARRAAGLVLVLLALFILVALITHDSFDDDRIVGSVDAQLNPFEMSYRNQAGLVGAYLSFLSFTIAGWLSFFVPIWLILLALRALKADLAGQYDRIATGALVVGVCVTTIFNLHILAERSITVGNGAAGGIVSEYLALASLKIVGLAGSYVVLGGISVIILALFTPIRALLGVRLPSVNVRGIGTGISRASRSIGSQIKPGAAVNRIKGLFASDDGELDFDEDELTEDATDIHDQSTRRGAARKEREEVYSGIDSDDATDREEATLRKAARKVSISKPAEKLHVSSVEYSYPPIDILSENSEPGPTVTKEELSFTSRMLRETLETFGVKIDGDIQSFPGPVITRYEFKPGTGVKVNQIVNLADDLALALRAKRIRIIAPIPGKAAVGLEIPNRKAQMVAIRDIVTTTVFNDQKLVLPLALGKSTSGEPFVTDLTKMPHLLIAGATGSGKSVCMNVLITSLLYRLHPVQVRFIFIDPKMLELSVYQGIPHLARPVVTKPKRAEKVLTEAVVEMEARYRRLANASVRNIADYNAKQTSDEEKLPYIVIFVDELADLMMSSTSSKTELLITRLAQMSRAVGIHLILATQRPSVDVITGLIKANFPARIAFQVSSKVDSRTIIDANGAEKLLGSGDMLFLPSGQPEPIRIHGAYISGDETEAVVSHIKDQGLEMMTLENISQTTGEIKETEVDTGDPLFKEACEVVIRHKQGSVSLLQRRLGIGYQRAARLIDKLEAAGVVSTFDGSKARDVLVDRTYLEKMFGGAASQPVSADENR